MSNPRPGGEADKFGNRYEGLWTVRYVLEVVADRSQTITVEPPDPEIGQGIEFRVQTNDLDCVHQVKRQRSGAASWTIKELANEGVLRPALNHARSERQFRFVSITPAHQLATLTDKARRSDDYLIFRDHMLSGEQGNWFSALADHLGNETEAWVLLRHCRVTTTDEDVLRETNVTVGESLFEGVADPRQISPIIGDFVLQNLGLALNKNLIVEKLLAEYGVQLRASGSTAKLVNRIRAANDRWVDSVETELLTPQIVREESARIVDSLLDPSESTTKLVTGDAGCGKSGVLYEIVQRLRQENYNYLVLRLDRFDPSQLYNSIQLGEAMALGASPVSALAVMAGRDPAVMIVDQLDALSLISGRAIEAFDVVTELVRESGAFPNIKVLFSCRSFDLKNDHRIRQLFESENVTKTNIGKLSDDQLLEALRSMGAPTSTLSLPQIELLKTPLHLRLFGEVFGEVSTFDFTTRKSLFDLYWDVKRQDCVRRGASVEQYVEIIGSAAEKMSQQQILSLPASAIREPLRPSALILTSAHVLVRDNKRWAFFHESFFDYAFARRWLERGQSVTSFIVETEQELFRRSQLRQILWHLRDDDEHSFNNQVSELLLSQDIRYHLKEVTLAVLADLSAPTVGAWQIVAELLEQGTIPVTRLTTVTQSAEWFKVLAEQEVHFSWFGSSVRELSYGALGSLRSGLATSPAKVVEILHRIKQYEDFPAWLQRVVSASDLESDRVWFDFVLQAVREERIDVRSHALWFAADELPTKRPTWAIELLAALLSGVHADTLTVGDRLELLTWRDELVLRFVHQTAVNDPKAYSLLVTRFLNEVIAATAYAEEEGLPQEDPNFSLRLYGNQFPSLGDQLVQDLATAAPDASSDLLTRNELIDILKAKPYHTFQFVLYRLLQEYPSELAEEAASILLDGPHRWIAGYSDSPFWETRKLLEKIVTRLPNATFFSLEWAALSYRPQRENYPSGFGHSAFLLLSSFEGDNRLGSAAKRFLEIRRGKLGTAAQIDEPKGIVLFESQSPVSQEDAESLSDDDWLRKLVEISTDRGDRVEESVGGAFELSSVLQSLIKRSPSRYMKLLQKLPPDANPAYIGAALRALGEEDTAADPDEVFRFADYCLTLNVSAIDRWVPTALRPHLRNPIPRELVGALTSRASTSEDPTPGRWQDAEFGERNSPHTDQLRFMGINSARGSLCDFLGDLLITDQLETRAEVIVPMLNTLASDPSLPVLSCVAHLVSAAIEHNLEIALEAFDLLIGADERLLMSRSMTDLIMFLGARDPSKCDNIVRAMMFSGNEDIAHNGGSLAAFFGLECDSAALLDEASVSSSVSVRSGAANVCARRLPFTPSRDVASAKLMAFMVDDDETVRAGTAGIGSALRDRPLAVHSLLLNEFIDSPSFVHGEAQFFITLERASEKVDGLIIRSANRFVELHPTEVSDISTSAAGDAYMVGELVMRAYAQATNADRKDALTLIDDLLRIGSFNMRDLLRESER